MIRPIVHASFMLNRPAQDASPLNLEDVACAQDLRDTLASHAQECVGMAANMIGQNKRIIIFADKHGARIMYNPVITKKQSSYEAQESCLSLPGSRPCTRYRSICVQYLNEQNQLITEAFSGFIAQIIQHEIDHTNGILI